MDNAATETAAPIPAYDAPQVARRGPWVQAARRFRRQRLAVVALGLLVALFLIGALAGVIAPYTYDHVDLTQVGKPPTAPTWRHLFGTDDIGHDMFSQTLYGLRTAIEVALAVAGISACIGVVVGSLAGYYGGWFDRIVSALVDGFVAVPALLIALVSVSAFRNVASPWRVGLTLAVVLWPPVARVVRANFVSLGQREYVDAARVVGASDARIVFRHLLPNTAGSVIVAATSVFGLAIILEATVDYFNYGLSGALTPTLGSLLADQAKNGGVGQAPWWLYVIPALVILLLLVCVNFVGDSLDDALNPARTIVRRGERAGRAPT